jgi:hypothetical protein
LAVFVPALAVFVPAGLVFAVPAGVCPAGAVLALLLQPANEIAEARIAAIARRRMGEAFMGEAPQTKGYLQPGGIDATL